MTLKYYKFWTTDRTHVIEDGHSRTLCGQLVDIGGGDYEVKGFDTVNCRICVKKARQLDG